MSDADNFTGHVLDNQRGFQMRLPCNMRLECHASALRRAKAWRERLFVALKAGLSHEQLVLQGLRVRFRVRVRVSVRVTVAASGIGR